ncbi:hypothetical protein GCM10018952_31490 [Streptosporangium vulgare]
MTIYREVAVTGDRQMQVDGSILLYLKPHRKHRVGSADTHAINIKRSGGQHRWAGDGPVAIRPWPGPAPGGRAPR